MHRFQRHYQRTSIRENGGNQSGKSILNGHVYSENKNWETKKLTKIQLTIYRCFRSKMLRNMHYNKPLRSLRLLQWAFHILDRGIKN